MKSASAPPQTDFLRAGPRVVGVACSLGDTRAARRLWPDKLDAIELRLDAMTAEEGLAAARLAARIGAPLILTLRHASEGGRAPMGSRERTRRLEAVFQEVAESREAGAGGGKEWAAPVFVDIELRQAGPMSGAIALARERGFGWIASFHDFRGTPAAGRLLRLGGEARAEGADIFKAACTPRSASDLARMLDFVVRWRGRWPFALMGMGPLGPASRLLFARLGSVLNYGHLGAPAAPGQWPAAVFKALLCGGS